MEKPTESGRYKVEIFNGERADPYWSEAIFNGQDWTFDEGHPLRNHHWHPNNLILSFEPIPPAS